MNLTSRPSSGQKLRPSSVLATVCGTVEGIVSVFSESDGVAGPVLEGGAPSRFAAGRVSEGGAPSHLCVHPKAHAGYSQLSGVLKGTAQVMNGKFKNCN